ncbi:MAG: alpha/beta hydrolase, partial [Candidatus Omnitrophica bacterium]|nr:alpha/beta hydrolase [Candidatus Omnitrophota bacterium]
FLYEQSLIEDNRQIFYYRINFSSPFRTGNPKNDKVFLDCFLPSKLESLLIILPGLGEGFLQNAILKRFAKKLAQNGRGVCILSLPYHNQRSSEDVRSGKLFLNLDAQETLDFFQQAVLDTERTIDFFEDKFDLKDFSILGISLGSIIAIISMAKDKRINKAILLLCGGNFFKILWRGLLYFFAKKDCNYRECRDNFKKLKQYQLKNFTDIKNLKFPKECMYYEPLVFARLLRERKILMFNSLFDMLIPFNSARELWKELGRPKIYWFPTEHHSIFLFSPLILVKIKRFLNSKEEIRKCCKCKLF